MARGSGLLYNGKEGTALVERIAAAAARGSQPEHGLLDAYHRFRAADRVWEAADAGSRHRERDRLTTERETLLRAVLGTPARSTAGIALKLALACEMGGFLERAQNVTNRLEEHHAVVAALTDALLLSGITGDDPKPRLRPTQPE